MAKNCKIKIKNDRNMRMILNLERCCIRGRSTISCDSAEFDLSQVLRDLLLLFLIQPPDVFGDRGLGGRVIFRASQCEESMKASVVHHCTWSGACAEPFRQGKGQLLPLFSGFWPLLHFFVCSRNKVVKDALDLPPSPESLLPPYSKPWGILWYKTKRIQDILTNHQLNLITLFQLIVDKLIKTN